MLSNIINNFQTQFQLPDITTTIVIHTPQSGFFTGGVLSTIGNFIWILFIILMLIWVALTMWAAYKIMSSQGNPQETEKGVKTIRNIWFGISAFMVFIVMLSTLGAFLGFGSVMDWSQNFKQCGSNQEFYFWAAEGLISLEEAGVPSGSVFCCRELTSSGYDGWAVVDSSDLSAIDPKLCTLEKIVTF
ncbi:MAG: hypothetical protein WCJ58_02825 [bacterium]